MERYESKHVRILKPSQLVYGTLSSFDNLTPILADKVDSWVAQDDCCSFKAKGFGVKLRIIERVEPKLIKVVGDDKSPMDFTFWVQLVTVSETDTRLRIVLDIELNFMMKKMIGGKIATAIDQIADQIADSFNRV